MDPLFERRNLTRSVRIPASQMQKNVRPALLAQLRSKYEGVCIPEGYCQPETIMVVEQSLGRTDLVHSGVEYHVVFQADICMPHAGQMWRGTVKLRSKIGVHVETGPVQVLLPRDIHMGDETFESIKENQQIEFEVIGSRFQQGDTTIAVLGKLKTVIAPEPFQPKTEESSEPMMAAPVTPSNAGEQKVVTVVPTAGPTAVPRKRKLNTNAKNE